jgi:ABC-type transporter Mla MlaB component
MLRITENETEGGRGLTYQLEGRLVGPWVQETQLLCEAALRSRESVTLDLAGVSFIDREGIALLRNLQSRNVHISNCSGFIAELLQGVAPC